MRFVDPPTLDSPWRERPGDDLDGLLTAFFQRELPSPWPAAPQAEETVVVRRRPPEVRRSAWTSRLALAASVAVLLGGGWLLSGSFLDGERDIQPRLLDNTANKSFKFETTLQEQPGGEIGIKIIVRPGAPKEDDLDKKIDDGITLPRE